MPPKKTNAARLLDELGIGYELHEAPYDEADLSATAMARSLGVPVEEVFKTLVVRGDKTGVLDVCLLYTSYLHHRVCPECAGRGPYLCRHGNQSGGTPRP